MTTPPTAQEAGHTRCVTLRFIMNSGVQFEVDVFTFQWTSNPPSLKYESPTGPGIHSLIYVDSNEIAAIMQVGDWRPLMVGPDGVSYVMPRPR
jgi:hypothetical protein